VIAEFTKEVEASALARKINDHLADTLMRDGMLLAETCDAAA
jgi:hypothetical protein